MSSKNTQQPRKFSEKIALLKQKEAESTATFDIVMRDVQEMDLTKFMPPVVVNLDNSNPHVSQTVAISSGNLEASPRSQASTGSPNSTSSLLPSSSTPPMNVYMTELTPTDQIASIIPAFGLENMASYQNEVFSHNVSENFLSPVVPTSVFQKTASLPDFANVIHNQKMEVQKLSLSESQQKNNSSIDLKGALQNLEKMKSGKSKTGREVLVDHLKSRLQRNQSSSNTAISMTTAAANSVASSQTGIDSPTGMTKNLSKSLCKLSGQGRVSRPRSSERSRGQPYPIYLPSPTSSIVAVAGSAAPSISCSQTDLNRPSISSTIASDIGSRFLSPDDIVENENWRRASSDSAIPQSLVRPIHHVLPISVKSTAPSQLSNIDLCTHQFVSINNCNSSANLSSIPINCTAVNPIALPNITQSDANSSSGPSIIGSTNNQLKYDANSPGRCQLPLLLQQKVDLNEPSSYQVLDFDQNLSQTLLMDSSTPLCVVTNPADSVLLPTAVTVIPHKSSENLIFTAAAQPFAPHGQLPTRPLQLLQGVNQQYEAGPLPPLVQDCEPVKIPDIILTEPQGDRRDSYTLTTEYLSSLGSLPPSSMSESPGLLQNLNSPLEGKNVIFSSEQLFATSNSNVISMSGGLTDNLGDSDLPDLDITESDLQLLTDPTFYHYVTDDNTESELLKDDFK